MKIDLERFTGTLPYASELFGIYQPLLGWKSKMTEERLNRTRDSVFRSFSERAISRARSDLNVQALHERYTVTGKLEVLDVVSTHYMPRVAREIDSIIARLIAHQLPVDDRPSLATWRTLLARPVLNAELSKAPERVQSVMLGTAVQSTLPADVLDYLRTAVSRLRPPHKPATEIPEVLKAIIDREVSVSTYLNWLPDHKPDLLNALFYRRVSDPFADMATYTDDPLASIGQSSLEAVLSPIGLVHLFRQYFFEFDTFLGPPVGHIWLSPGSSLELVEETVRRTVSEREFESLVETADKTEKNVAVHDELSTAIREENRSDLKFGFGASVNYHNGTLDAGAHTDLSLDNSRTTARETVHKQMRDQSEKLTSEIRQSFKSRFRTVVETTETSSRRYVLQNTTQDLINYELRRKMRQVGVQVQDIGTQLCWQVFIDDPGKTLGIAKLLHVPEPPDLAGLRAPEPQARLEPKVVDINLQFPYMRNPESEGDGEMDVLYIEGDDQEHVGGIHNIGYNDRIFHTKQYDLTPPAPGYTLSGQITVQHHHSGPCDAEVKWVGGNRIEVILHQVNFKDQPAVELQVTTTWKPDDAQQKALDATYLAALAKYDAEKAAAERAAFLKAARERIKLASQVRKRPFQDLREEERIVVYRNLIGQLMSVGENLHQDEHVTSELIRAIFNVDEMLYFVAPDWWRSRSHQQVHRLTTAPDPQVITDKDLVTWEGPRAPGRSSNYLITEESDPAPLGSSLGWLLQLDGDPLRNAFLNSPWVKAIIPIRPGKEEAAINWLKLAHVAGATGLDGRYDAPPEELEKIRSGLEDIGREVGDEVTLLDALLYLGNKVKTEYKAATTAKPSPFDPNKNVIPTETVFEHGFDPLQGGFEVNLDPTKVFSQWIEVLATDQVAAVPYDAAAHL